MQPISTGFEITEQSSVRTQGGRTVVSLEAGKPGEYYLRLRSEQPLP
jgi:hypothetical protein